MPRKSKKPHVVDALNTIRTAIEKASELAQAPDSNHDLKMICHAGCVDLHRALRFISNLSDWGKL